jgi:hypothetical protein
MIYDFPPAGGSARWRNDYDYEKFRGLCRRSGVVPRSETFVRNHVFSITLITVRWFQTFRFGVQPRTGGKSLGLNI